MQNESESAPSQIPSTDIAETTPSGFRSAREALSAFAECGGRLSEYVERLDSAHADLERETQSLRERESRLTSELMRLRSLDEEVEKHRALASDSDRRRAAHEEQIRSIEGELTAKTEALNTLRADYKLILERHATAAAELEVVKVGLADTERKRSHAEESAEENQRELRSRKKENSELNTKLVELTAELNATQAKLHEVEEALLRSSQEVAQQTQELKELRRELIEKREEYKATSAELSRKTQLVDQHETSLQERAELVRQLQDEMADLKREAARTASLLTEQETALSRAGAKIAEQSQAVVALDRDLAKAQDEAEQKRRALRQSEEKRKLEESDRQTLEQELKTTADGLKRKTATAEALEKQVEGLNARLTSEMQKRRDIEEQRTRARADAQAVRDELVRTTDQVNAAMAQCRAVEDESAGLKKDLEALQHEHKNLLRVESRQAEELERVAAELNKRTELLREMQTKAAAMREQLDHAKMTLDQQAMSISSSRQQHARDQEELQTYKRQLQRIARVPEIEAQLDEAREESKALKLRLAQKDELIGILQTRLNEKRPVQLVPGRENSQTKPAAEPETRFTKLKSAANDLPS